MQFNTINDARVFIIRKDVVKGIAYIYIYSVSICATGCHKRLARATQFKDVK